MKISFSVLPILALSACVQFETTAETAPAKATSELCKSIAAARAGNTSEHSAELAFIELQSRKDFTGRELDMIARGVAVPGMSEAAGLCAWGNYWYDVSTTTVGSSVNRQYVFGDGNYNPRRYLYTENGVVTATQE